VGREKGFFHPTVMSGPLLLPAPVDESALRRGTRHIPPRP
jgi:hypothetical protein